MFKDILDKVGRSFRSLDDGGVLLSKLPLDLRTRICAADPDELSEEIIGINQELLERGLVLMRDKDVQDAKQLNAHFARNRERV